MGGEENDAPYLTDSIMAVTIDPTTNRVMMVSIPRDLTVHMNLQTNPSRIWTQKINAAYEVPYVNIICCVAPQYAGPHGGGAAAEHEVGKVTGQTFDRYMAVDFKAFRDMVNALGGVDICLSTNLDDIYYPNYNISTVSRRSRSRGRGMPIKKSSRPTSGAPAGSRTSCRRSRKRRPRSTDSQKPRSCLMHYRRTSVPI
jgi:LCP family protein required for cell wall assembly